MSYGTELGFTTYHTARGNDVSAMSSAQILVALQVGTDYVDGRYGACFVGRRADGYSQDEEWPRSGAVDMTGTVVPSTLVPNNIVYAAYEAGLANYNEAGVLTPSVAPSDRKVLTQVDVVKWSVIGGDSDMALRTTLTRVEDLVSPLIDCDSAAGNAPFLGVI